MQGERRDDERAVETDDRFPSGPWIGYYQQWDHQARQRLSLTFVGGSISGVGSDPGGDFVVRGTYDVSTGKASITKTYHRHVVEYDGVAGEDGIAGNWVIRGFGGMVEDRGQFLIWPDASAGAGESLHVEAEVPVSSGR